VFDGVPAKKIKYIDQSKLKTEKRKLSVENKIKNLNTILRINFNI
jgi:hypothetical protein